MSSQLAALDFRFWFGGLTMIAVFVAGFWVLPRVWRGELAPGGEHAPEWWPWGEALWQGMRRMGPLCYPGAGVFLAAGVGLSLVPEQPAGAFVRPYWAVIPALGAIGLLGALMLGVVFFNRPKFIVPPYLRDQPGALAAWLTKWRQGRAERRARDARR